MKRIKPISLTIIIFSLALLGSYHIYYHFVDNINDSLVNDYEENIESINSIGVVEKINNNKENYIGLLEIPKINLKKGFYNVNSSLNNVNQNIELLKNSNMPDKEGTTIYLAAHSGNSYLGFFKNLKYLNLNDEIIIYYNNIKYTYIINNVYEMDKNGYIEINKNNNDNYVVLTTCNDNMQLVITAKLYN